MWEGVFAYSLPIMHKMHQKMMSSGEALDKRG